MSLPNGIALLASLSRLTPYSTSEKDGPKGGKIETSKFRLESLDLATVQIPVSKLKNFEDVPAEGKVPAHKRWNLANVQVHVFEGVEIGEDGRVTGLVEVNARRVRPSWADSEQRVHLSVNVKPATSAAAPTALVQAYADKRPEAPAAAITYGPDSKGGNILVATL